MKELGKLEALADTLQRSVLEEIERIPGFSGLPDSTAECLRQGWLVEASEGDRLLEQGQPARFFWIMLSGSARIEIAEQDGSPRVLAMHCGSHTFGELPLLAGSPSRTSCVASEAGRLLRLDEESFWQLMTSCPAVRRTILANMAHRMEALQALMLEREKLASLGTMTASLMHELKNPGAAARRASALLRESLEHLQQLSVENLGAGFRQEEIDCLAGIQKDVLNGRTCSVLGSVEQADAEEALNRWLEGHGIRDGWKIAGPLVTAGLTEHDMACLPETFRPAVLSGALNWIGAFISSMQQLHTVEESIGRITDLVTAVKRYAYAGNVRDPHFDLNESLQGALIILGYKLRQKNIRVVREFASGMPRQELRSTGLGQVWTNLLDNAIDAAPEGGQIVVRTWTDGKAAFVAIRDDGAGVPEDIRGQVFEPFFTTKPIGSGTGLGLSIAFKIVTAGFGGSIEFESRPGRTEFIVRLPLLMSTQEEKPS